MPANAKTSGTLYRVAFINQNEVYELFARSVGQSQMFGFIEIEELVFGERSAVVVDPTEERLASEFAKVKRSYLPLQSIIRIDEVTERGTARVTPAAGENKVAPFPGGRGPGAGRGGDRG